MKIYKENFIVIAFLTSPNSDEIQSFAGDSFSGYVQTVSSYEEARKYHTYKEATEAIQNIRLSHPKELVKLVRCVRNFEGVSKSDFNY